MVREHIAVNSIGPGHSAVEEARLPFRYTPYQVRHTHASWLIDQGVDLAPTRPRRPHYHDDT
jgi:integrase